MQSMTKNIIFLVIIAIIVTGFIFYKNSNQFQISDKIGSDSDILDNVIDAPENNTNTTMQKSNREISTTDGVKHSIPLNEILSGGPQKDGIPSIDEPKFISTKEADEFLKATDVGLGIVWKEEARFYPYQILVWHEIVNDTIAGDPILVSYCPLCATGVAFDAKINEEATEFGVSGKLWQSNLLMYNRSKNPEDESLWSQVLGEAVLGALTGVKLKIVTSDTVLYGDWKKSHPNTKVLSKDTGSTRSYGSDSYGDYYTSESVSFGATFNDTRLHPKAFVLGIEIDGKYKAYSKDAIKVGETVDSFADKKITIERNDTGEIRIFTGDDKKERASVGGFWFSWLAVHPNTELYAE